MAIPRAFASHFLALALLLVVTPLCTARIILYSGETLKSGQSLTYLKSGYEFKMQEDCNAVLYDSNEPIWASQTWDRGSHCYITLQPDGNLVIYNDNNAPVWASNTNLVTGNYALILQKDRNLVIYGPARWATNTNIGVSGGMFIESKATIFGALPANKTTEEAKPSGTIAMVVDNI